MIVREMRGTDCYNLIKAEHVARLACSKDDQPYVVPIQYAYSDSRLFSFSMPGHKIEIMRANPRVCLEIERVSDLQHWKCVVVEGLFHEFLPDVDRQHAWELLQDRTDWWQPGALKPTPQPTVGERSHIFYEILINEITGREGAPS